MIAQAQNKTETAEYNGKTRLKGKRERFAQLLSTDKYNQTEAAREANYKDHKGLIRYAHELATNPVIKARIAYLRQELAKKWDITKESQVKEYIGIRDRAITAGDLRAEISANNSIDKLCGLIVDKIQNEPTGAQEARTAAQRQLDRDQARIALQLDLEREKASNEPVMELTDV